MSTICRLFGHSPYTGFTTTSGGVYVNDRVLLGLEFELEGMDSGGREDVDGFDRHSDASLRDGVEYVFDSGSSGGAALSRVRTMGAFLAANTYSTSERTSTHIHMNMRDGATMDTVRSIYSLVFLIEPAIFRFADENRKWCSYCQPLTDMSQARTGDIIAGPTDSAFRNGVVGHSHQDKYHGLNLKALSSHGTLEFRYFPGWVDVDTTNSWINLVLEIRMAAEAASGMDGILAMGMEPSSLREFLAAHMPRSFNNLMCLVEDTEIKRRALYLQGVRDVHAVQPLVAPSRLSAVLRDSAMAQVLQNLLNLNLTTEGRAAETIADIINNGNLSEEMIEELAEVLRSTASVDFLRVMEEVWSSGEINTRPQFVFNR